MFWDATGHVNAALQLFDRPSRPIYFSYIIEPGLSYVNNGRAVK